MRNQFREGELPGESPFRSAGSDISDFQKLYQAALETYAACGKPELSEPGWQPAGKRCILEAFLKKRLTRFR